jgi:hypothetical protein
MVEISQLLQGLASVGVIVGTIFAVAELRTMSKARKTQLVIDLTRHMATPEFMEQMEKIFFTDISDGKEARAKIGYVPLMTVSMVFEEIGLMLRLKLIDYKVVHETMSIEPVWNRMRPWCLYVRSISDPYTFENFEYAAESARTYHAERMSKWTARQEKKGKAS